MAPRQPPHLNLIPKNPRGQSPNPPRPPPKHPRGPGDVLDSGNLPRRELVNDCLIGCAEGAGWVKSARAEKS